LDAETQAVVGVKYLEAIGRQVPCHRKTGSWILGHVKATGHQAPNAGRVRLVEQEYHLAQ